jgi:hypothetical protein
MSSKKAGIRAGDIILALGAQTPKLLTPVKSYSRILKESAQWPEV